jgi:hypothetical protein
MYEKRSRQSLSSKAEGEQRRALAGEIRDEGLSEGAHARPNSISRVVFKQ